ncbi:hypothetical protein D9M68_525200 [compost metagenome]
MAVAVQVLDHRHPRIAADALDQAFAAARHDHVDELRHADQRADSGTVGGVHHLHGGGRQTGLGEAALDTGGDGAVGMNGFRAATQDGGVTGLQAQAGSVDGHVGSRLVNDTDHPERHTHLADLNAGRTVAHVADRTDRVGQVGDLAQAFDHPVDACRSQRQAVEQCRLQAIGTAGGQVLLIGRDQLGASGIQRRGRGLQGAILLRGSGTGNHARSLAGGLPQAGHVVEHGLSHGLRTSGSWKKLLIIAAPPPHAQRRRADGKQPVFRQAPVTAQAASRRRLARDGDTRGHRPPEGWVNKTTADVYLQSRLECRAPRRRSLPQ